MNSQRARPRGLLVGIAVLVLLRPLEPRPLHAGDCDRNGEEDRVEIAAGTARDCDQNGFPDACDLTPTFGAAYSIRSRLAGAPVSLLAADLDQDAVPDLAVLTSSESTVSVLRVRRTHWIWFDEMNRVADEFFTKHLREEKPALSVERWQPAEDSFRLVGASGVARCGAQ